MTTFQCGDQTPFKGSEGSFSFVTTASTAVVPSLTALATGIKGSLGGCGESGTATTASSFNFGTGTLASANVTASSAPSTSKSEAGNSGVQASRCNNDSLQFLNLIMDLQSIEDDSIEDNEEVQKFLQDPEIIIGPLTNKGVTLLHYAAMSRDESLMKLLIKHNPNSVNVKDNQGRLTMHYTSELKLVKVLVEAGSDVNAQDNGGCTPLMRATSLLEYDTMLYLLENGCNPNLKEPNRRLNPKYLCESKLFIKILEYYQSKFDQNIVSDVSVPSLACDTTKA